jgi:hypothetical protein
MEKLNIYEYVAVIVPGVVFLFGLGVMLPESYVFHRMMMPQDMGTAAVHLFLAFALGHMLQVIGQHLHAYYWSDFGGFPTDWPFSRQHKELSPALQQVVLEASGQSEVTDLFEWRRAVATVRSLVTTEGFASRLETFHANYGMFRSTVVAGVLLLLVMPWCKLDFWLVCPLIVAGVLVSLLGMHRFGVHYARELFAAAHAWQQSQAAWAADDRHDNTPVGPRRMQTLKFAPRPSRSHKKAA